MVVTTLSGLIIVISGGVLNPIFRITLVVFVKFLQRYSDYKIPISAFDKAVFSTPDICGHILNIFWGL